MGNSEHMKRIQNCTVEEWNKWRSENLRIQPDLTRIDLRGRNLNGIDFRGVGLFKAVLSDTKMVGANLRQAIAIKTEFEHTDLTGAYVYGISAWDIVTDKDTIQKDLIITEPGQPIISVDNIKVAQFIHLMLNNKEIRDVIDTISKKAVLILGRFTVTRKPILEAIKEELRLKNYLPILFDFDKPDNRSFIETVSTLAHMSRFIIADSTTPKIILQELTHIAPHLAVPIKPIIQGKRKEPVTIYDLRKNIKSVLETFRYNDVEHLIKCLDESIIIPAEEKALEFNKY